MDVLLIGATGYIGSAVAGALQAVGHRIHGLARSDQAARTLQARGITPVPGDLQEPARLEVVAHAADAVIYAGFIQHNAVAHVERAAIEAIIRGLQETGRPFIYTSAVWVLGHGDTSMMNPPIPRDTPASPVWRLLVEIEVLDANARGAEGMVIRPAVVYGRGGGLV